MMETYLMAPRTRRILGSCLLGWLLLACLACTPADEPGGDDVGLEDASSAHGNFLSFSDLHFDPFYDPTLFASLMEKDYTEWAGIFESSDSTSFLQQPRYQHDTNYPLLQSALSKMHESNDAIDYVLITGDFLVHRFPDSFDVNYSNYTGPKKSEESDYKAFVEKTMNFLAQQLTKAFPRKPIFPSFGNNDSYCGDYNVNPHSDFVKAFIDTWRPSIEVSPTTQSAEFSEGGSYIVSHPFVEGHSFIIVNDIYFSGNYNKYPPPSWGTTCQPADSLGQNEIAWLNTTLQKTTGKVTIAFHIPPGIDNDGTGANPPSRSGSSCKTNTSWISLAYNTVYIDALGQTLDTYAPRVQQIFAGHDHINNFRLFTFRNGGTQTVVPMHLTPAISPKYENNSGFQVFSYDLSTGDLTDYDTYYLSNLSTAGTPQSGNSCKLDDPSMPCIPGDWQLLYTFTGSLTGNPKGYGKSQYNVQALQDIANSLVADSTSQTATNYQLFYGLGGNTRRWHWPVFACTIQHRTADSFLQDCYCQ